MMIGRGRREGNLYIFFYFSSSVSTVCNNVSLSQSELWHHHLGHPSYVKLHTMSNELNISSQFVHPSHCSICPLAKQKHLSFPISNKLSAAPFELIHCDVFIPLALKVFIIFSPLLMIVLVLLGFIFFVPNLMLACFYLIFAF